MREFSRSRLLSPLLFLFLLLAGPPALSQGGFDHLSTLMVPYGEDPGAVGYREATEEAQAMGPQVVRSGIRGSYVLLDSLRGRIVEMAASGKVVRDVPLSLAAMDMVVGPSGEMMVLGEEQHRLLAVTPQGGLRTLWAVPPALKPLRGLAWGPQGVMVENVHGITAPVGWTPAQGGHMGLLGERGPVLSRRVSASEARVRTPEGRFTVGPAEGMLLGAARVIAAPAGRVYLLIESLAPDPPLQVHRLLLMTDLQGAALASMTLPPLGVYVPQRGLDVAPDGSVVTMTPRAEGLELQRYVPSAQEVRP